MSKIKNKFLSQMATLTLKGNNTGGTANPLDLTVTQVNAMLGDILANGTVAMSASLNLGTNQIINVVDPTTAQMAATKNYVDTSLAALNPADAAYAATAGSNISGTYINGVAGIGATFITTATGTFTVDGTTPPINARILIKDQTSGFQNGVYTITTLGSLGVQTTFTRASDYNTASDMNSAGLIPVINGTTNALSSWQQIATITTVGTDSLVFSEFTANPSLYLLKANNLSDVSSKITSFNNLSPMTTGGDLIYGGASGTGTRLANGSAGQVLTSAGTTLAPTWSTPATGSVTSVALSDASTTPIYTVSGSPVTSSGILTLTLSTQAAHAVFAGPTSGSAAQPTFRALVSGDIPNNAANTTGTSTNVTGTVAIGNGGTGQATANAAFNALSPMTTGGDIIFGSTSGVGTRLAIGSTGNVLTVSGGIPTWAAPATPTLSSLGIRAGRTSISSGSTSQAVTFSTALGSTGTDYAITATLINTTDTNVQFQPVTVTATSTTGFTAKINAPTSTANYALSWQAILNN